MCEVMEKYAKEYAKEYAASEKERDILNALKKGISVEVICAVMGVPEERVNELRETMKKE